MGEHSTVQQNKKHPLSPDKTLQTYIGTVQQQSNAKDHATEET